MKPPATCYAATANRAASSIDALPANGAALQGLLCYCRPGFEPELAAELSARAAGAGVGGYARTERGSGYVVFAGESGDTLSRVLPQHCSVAHAETMAYMLAQQRTQRSRLNLDEAGGHVGPITLATSSQPCCQCYGATFWAGIDRLLIGARSEDVMALTEFDEGPLPADWVGELERRGITVVRDLHRDAACDVLRSYGNQGGKFY